MLDPLDYKLSTLNSNEVSKIVVENLLFSSMKFEKLNARSDRVTLLIFARPRKDFIVHTKVLAMTNCSFPLVELVDHKFI